MRIMKCALPAVAALLLTTSSSLGQAEGYEVETDVTSHEATQDIHVWHPGSDGEFPVVYALHGLGGTAAGWDVIAPALAEHGVVVFATDYHSTDITQGRIDRIMQDLGCGYRYVREVAADYGGDLSQPVAFVGHSLGAEMALGGGLDDTQFVPDGPYTTCFTGADRPDAIVAIGGCYYEFEGQHFPFDASQYGAGDARTVLVGGEDDEICAAWQSRDATEAFAASGREATYVEIPGATHLTLIGHDFVDGEWLTLPDHPAAAEVTQIILDVIASEQADSDSVNAVVASGAEATPIDPTAFGGFTGSMSCAQGEYGTTTRTDWGSIVEGETYPRCTIETSDPRVSGSHYSVHDYYRYGGRPLWGVRAPSLVITNDKGAWVSTDGWGYQQPWDGAMFYAQQFRGTGAYEGLTALMVHTQDTFGLDMDVEGVIFPGELPEAPEPPIEEALAVHEERPAASN